MPLAAECQMNISGCSRNVRSSSLCNLESSALIGHGGNTRGTVDVSKRARPAEGPTRGQKTAHHPEAGSGGVGTERELGLSARWVRTLLKRLRREGDTAAAQTARATFEPEDAGGGKTTRGRAVPAETASEAVARLRPHAGGRRIGGGPWDPGEPGNAAAMADRGHFRPWSRGLQVVND